MAESSAAGSFGKFALGGAVGFGLYMLITGLGFGFGGGRGGHREDGRDGAVPTRLRDEERLNFLMSSKGLELRGADWKPAAAAKILTLEEAVARVKDGGRLDLNLKISGDAIQRDVDAALAAFKQHGIDVLMVEMALPHVSGNARGQYGRQEARR